MNTNREAADPRRRRVVAVGVERCPHSRPSRGIALVVVVGASKSDWSPLVDVGRGDARRAIKASVRMTAWEPFPTTA